MSFQLRPVSEIIEAQPRRHKLKTNEYLTHGTFPIVDQGASFIAGFTDNGDRTYNGPLPVIVFGDHTCCLKYVDFRFAIGADGTQVLRPVGGVDGRYLFYALHTADLAQFGYQRHFKILKDCQVQVPPIETQRRIASILGAYDDLIEINRQRVAVLEEMARGLFKEWFVRFRFPGHESVPIVETPDGPLPEGWENSTIDEVTSYLNRGIAPKYDEASDTLVIGQKCIRDGRLSLALARRQSKAPPAGKIVREGDVLINSTGVGTLGRVAQAEEVPEGLTADSHVTIVRPTQEVDRDFLGLLLIGLQPTFEHLGAGSTGQTELSRTAVGALSITWPTADLRASFGQRVRPMRMLIAGLIKANQRLAAARDLLLPRLISGQLSVEAAERQLVEAA